MRLYSPKFVNALLLAVSISCHVEYISGHQINSSQNLFGILRGGSSATSTTDTTPNNNESSKGAVTDKDESEGIFTITPEQRSNILSSSSTDFVSSQLASKIKHFYDSQGYVLIRGLIDPEMLRRLQRAGNRVIEELDNVAPSSFTSMQFGSAFSSSPSDDGDEENDQSIFREVALESAIPAFISRILMQLQAGEGSETDASNLRLLNDVFLAKTGKEESFCGWHVDDFSFWPCSAHQDPNTPVGVNAWIALDDIPAKTYGGGMAIVPKSHSEDCEWRQRGYEAIGSTQTHPAEEFSSLLEMTQLKPTLACDLPKLDPELNHKLEKIKKVFDYQQGDVLLCSRWLWHRSMQLGEEGHKKVCNDDGEDLKGSVFKRYTIRYESGKTRLLSGASTQESVLLDKSNAGKTLDYICSSSGLPFFPQAWPNVLESEHSRLGEFTRDILPKARAKKIQMMEEMFQAIAAANESKKTDEK